MKRIVPALLLSSLFITAHNASALDIQAGEWKMENIDMRTVDVDTGQVLMDQKNSGVASNICYTPKMAADSKKMVKGFSHTEGGCTVTFLESTDTKLVNETVCNNDKTKTHSVVETTKISDTEFSIDMKMDMDSYGQKRSSTNKVRQIFVGKTCSEASKGPGTK